MTELLTAAQMRAIEGAAIDTGAVTGLELMERAGRGAVEAILAEWPELASGRRRALVLCGPGNNGGDGFVVARLLRARGWDVEVFLHGDPERLPPDARANHERWCGMGEVGRLPAALRDPSHKSRTWLTRDREGPVDLVVDALFGTGLTRAIDDEVVRAILDELAELDERLAGPRRATSGPSAAPRLAPSRALPSSDGRPTRVVAIDLPSGLCGDSGRWLGPGMTADLTVTFHREKLAHRLAEGPEACGKISVVDIGIGSRGILRSVSPTVGHRWLGAAHDGREPNPMSRALEAEAAAVGLMVRTPSVGKADGHKFDHGHALLLSGGVGRGGAARMAARGALRIGAGLVTLGCPPAAVIENAARLDAIMLRPVRDERALAAMLEDDRLNALCLGPGLGTGEREAKLVRVALGGAAGERSAAAASEDQGLGEGAEGDEGNGDRGAPDATRGPDRRGGRAGSEGASGDRGVGESAASSVSRSAFEDGGPGREAGAMGEGGGRRAPDDGGRPASDGRRRAIVLDGDALSILARSPALFALLHDRCVLTPHAGEFARLFPDIAERLNAPAETGPATSKVDAARDAAARAGCVVLLKGPDTVIAHPDGRAAVSSAHYERSAPWLATAGAGDVLAGFVAGLLARGLSPMRAAEAAAWLHVECALEFGPGLIAEDLPEQLPKVLRRLGV